MAKVLFVNPVVREEDLPRHVPYGMALLASLAIKQGHLVQVYDANAWRLEDDVLRQVLEADDWDVIAVGGIQSPEDILEYMVVGASAVQIGAANFWHPQACAHLLQELERQCFTGKIGNINDLRGSFNRSYH